MVKTIDRDRLVSAGPVFIPWTRLLDHLDDYVQRTAGTYFAPYDADWLERMAKDIRSKINAGRGGHD